MARSAIDTSAWAALERALQAPWKVRNELARFLIGPVVKVRLALAGVTVGRGLRCYGWPVVQRSGGSEISIGAHVTLRSGVAANPLSAGRPVVLSTRSPGAYLRIGEGAGLSSACVVAAVGVSIGQRVLIGANATIVDNDFHPLPSSERGAADGILARPVVIEDDVFVGMNAMILKGVRIGTGAVVGAGAVVTKDVPAGTICAGNPARILRTLRGSTG